MDAIANCSFKVVTSEYGGDRASLPFGENAAYRTEVRFSRAQKLGFLGFSSARHESIRPMWSLSSNIEHASLQAEADVGTEEDDTVEIYPSKTVRVRFQLKKECQFGEQFLIVGDDPTLGSWDPSSAVPLNWSDEHIWSVELDILIRREIQFKLILNKGAGGIQWQPDPDRVVQTWDTNNTITVYEDWDNAELQKVCEEDLLENVSKVEELKYDSERLMFAENLTHPRDEIMIELSNGSAFTENYAAPEDNPLMEAHKHSIASNDTAHLEEMPVAIFADNISQKVEQSSAGSTSKVHSEKKIANKNEGQLQLPHGFIEENGRATVNYSTSMNFQNDLVTCDEGPVLVPGLTQLSTVLIEESNQCDERSKIDSASAVPDEESASKVPEQELESDQYQEETALIFAEREEQLDDQREQINHLDSSKEKPDHDTSNDVFKSDVRWGRKTLQKLLANLGFQ